MMRALGITIALLFTSAAHAKGPGWFLAGAGEVEVQGAVELPLLRGEQSLFRPSVMVQSVIDGKSSNALAVIDLGHDWTRLGSRLARRLGIETESTTLHGSWTRIAVIPELHLGGVVLRDLQVEVVEGDDLIVGFGTIPELAVAILPSKGVVKLVPQAEGEALLASVGESMPVTKLKPGGFKFAGEKTFGNGLSMAVPGAIAGRDGLVGIQTDASTTRVTRNYSATDERRRRGVIHYRGRGRVAGSELPESWLMRDESLAHTASTFIGALGYDQLYRLDLASHPAKGTLAAAAVLKPMWTGTTDAALQVAQERYEAAGYELDEDESDRPPRMGFEEETSNPEGDPGESGRRDLEGELAEALWQAGHLDDALRHFREASRAAGDNCGPYRELGVRRLAWSGSLQRQKFITELIRQPLRRAGELWDLWAELTPAQREKVRNYDELESGVFSISQDSRCRTAWGTLMASYIRQGNTVEASAIYKQHHGTDPLVAFAQGLSLIERGQPKTAEIPIREALSYNVAERGDIKLGLGAAQVAQGLKEPVAALVREIPGLEVDHGITAALIAVSWGQMLDGEAGAKQHAAALVSEDRYWIPGQLVGLWLGVEEADKSQLGAELVRQIPRDAGAPRVTVERAVYQALEGSHAEALASLDEVRKSSPPTADLYAAFAWVHHLAGDAEARDAAIVELSLRFPTIPIGDLRVLQSVR